MELKLCILIFYRLYHCNIGFENTSPSWFVVLTHEIILPREFISLNCITISRVLVASRLSDC